MATALWVNTAGMADVISTAETVMADFRAADRHAAADQHAGKPAADQVADVGRDERNPGRVADPGEGESVDVGQGTWETRRCRSTTPGPTDAGEHETGQEPRAHDAQGELPAHGRPRLAPWRACGRPATRAIEPQVAQRADNHERQLPADQQHDPGNQEHRARMVPTAAPLLKIPEAKARSAVGNHSVTTLIAAGQLPASPRPSRKRHRAQAPRPPGQARGARSPSTTRRCTGA